MILINVLLYLQVVSTIYVKGSGLEDFYRQNYCSITVVSQQLPHKAGIDINKEQGGGKVRGGNRGSRCDASRAQVHFFSFFFFLILLIKYINRYYRP